MKTRIKKKLRKNSVLILDTSSIPIDMTVEDWIVWIEKYGMIYYDSRLGNTPIVKPNKNKVAYKFINKNDNTKIISNC